MNILFFDTETTGLPVELSDGSVRWPRLVQLACLLTDADGRELESYCTLVRPVGYRIPQEATAVHGITTEKAVREGVSVKEAVDAFLSLYDWCDMVVGHNVEFDEGVIGAEIDRLGAWGGRKKKPTVCTMKPSAELVGIWSERKQDWKWPKLIELHWKLFGCGFEGAHDALCDIRATARCYFELVKRGVLEGGDHET